MGPPSVHISASIGGDQWRVMVRTSPDLRSDGLKRDVGLLGLMWASEGSLIGSGWLFGAFFALTYAGPSALIGWVIASVIVILLALVHAELGGMFPVSGGTSRFPHYAFGSLAGGTFGWFAYIQAATVAPVEVLATIQYFSTVSWASTLVQAADHRGDQRHAERWGDHRRCRADGGLHLHQPGGDPLAGQPQHRVSPPGR